MYENAIRYQRGETIPEHPRARVRALVAIQRRRADESERVGTRERDGRRDPDAVAGESGHQLSLYEAS